MMNVVTLVGRLTKDPVLRHTEGGVAVASFTIAVNRDYTNQAGEREADFINIVAWKKTAENVANFMKKGSLVGVEGKIQTRSYDGQDQKRVYVTEVVANQVKFLEPKANGGNQPSGNTGGNQPSNNNGGNNYNNNNAGNNYNNNAGNNNNGGSNYNNNNGGNNYNNNNGGNNYNNNNNNDPFGDPFNNHGGPIEVSDDDLPF